MDPFKTNSDSVPMERNGPQRDIQGAQKGGGVLYTVYMFASASFYSGYVNSAIDSEAMVNFVVLLTI